jgi:transglutaminase-like putative cysteine protease
VRLGTSGLLSESATPVLELRVLDSEGNTVADERFERVYLRGAVLEDYDGASGRWRTLQREMQNYGSYQASPGRPERVSFPVRDAPIYSFRMDFRNKSPGELFTVHRPVSFVSDVYAPYVRDRATLVIESDLSGRVSYTVQAQLDAQLVGADSGVPARLPPLFREGAVRRETERVLAEAGLSRDPSDRWTREDESIVRALERNLQTRYEYTTEMTAPDAGEDPIEMFLFRTRRGHCQYFASALAAMCRSVGIDARVVTGYVASERDESGVYTVRESHAHAWVEANVGMLWWRTFDPSPAEGVALAHTPESGLVARARSLIERLERLWIHGVVSYRTSPGESSRPPAWLQSIARRLGGPGEARGGDEGGRGSGSRGVWVAVAQGAGVFALVAGAGFGGVALAGWIARATRARRARAKAATEDPTLPRREQQAAFYGELLRALARKGAAKPAWRPPLVHLMEVGVGRPGVLGPGERLVQLYYASRFGRRLLSGEEVAEAARLVREMEVALAAGPAADGAVGSRHGP